MCDLSIGLGSGVFCCSRVWYGSYSLPAVFLRSRFSPRTAFRVFIVAVNVPGARTTSGRGLLKFAVGPTTARNTCSPAKGQRFFFSLAPRKAQFNFPRVLFILAFEGTFVLMIVFCVFTSIFPLFSNMPFGSLCRVKFSGCDGPGDQRHNERHSARLGSR